MKSYIHDLGFCLIAISFIFTACVDDSGSGGRIESSYLAGDVEIFMAENVNFTMVYVPGALTFPTGVNDSGTATIDDAYWIGDSEVTFELWLKVYMWAIDSLRGANQYHFSYTGTQGDGTGDTIQHPVTCISWLDSLVWCNALTEWYNSHKGTSYDCVYYYSNTIIRDSASIDYNNVVALDTAKGFRLPTTNEWELAARYRDGINWTYGDHVSGDDSGACFDDGEILGELGISTFYGYYAVYDDNSGASTAEVKSKIGNALGLHDMSGNVFEWCFGLDSVMFGPDHRGGSYDSSEMHLQLGHLLSNNICNIFTGFRFAKTQ